MTGSGTIQKGLCQALSVKSALFIVGLALSGLVATAIAPPASAAPGAVAPAFDCGRATATAENIVCADPLLAELDREVARLNALALATPDMAAERRAILTAMQRGWVKGRNACWKANSGLYPCILSSYGQRIAELRQGYAHARSADARGISTGPVPHACTGSTPVISLVTLASEPPLMVVGWGDWTLTLTRLSPRPDDGDGTTRYGLSDFTLGPVTLTLEDGGQRSHLSVGGQPAQTCTLDVMD